MRGWRLRRRIRRTRSFSLRFVGRRGVESGHCRVVALALRLAKLQQVGPNRSSLTEQRGIMLRLSACVAAGMGMCETCEANLFGFVKGHVLQLLPKLS